MKRNQLLELTTTALDADLAGESVVDDVRVKVAGAVPGDRVEARIVSVSRHRPLAHAEIARVIARDARNFTAPPCPHAAPLRGRCGGCPAQHVAPALQDAARREHVEALFAAAGLTPGSLRFVPAPARLGYRNRTNYVVARDAQQRIVLGSFAPRSREVASMDGCLVVQPAIARVARALRAALERHAVPTDSDPDALRWVTLRADAHDAVVVDLVARREAPAWLTPVAADAMAIDGVAGVALSVNDAHTNAVRVAASRPVAGRTTLHDTLGRVPLEIPAGAFAQLNREVASRMYLRAAGWLATLESSLDGDAVVWDLYGGLGGLGLNVALASPRARLFGADAIATSIDAANRTAAALGPDVARRARYEVFDHAEGVPDAWPAPTAVIVNPPRRGLDDAVAACLERSPATHLLYMSCSAASFTRDAARLASAGWQLGPVEIHDMLPQTPHVELLAMLRRAA